MILTSDKRSYDRMKRNQTIICFILLLIVLAGCAIPAGPVFKKYGRKFGIVRGSFTGQWYDYYERGLSYMEGKFYKHALDDFEAAINQRPDDKWWANTYGGHRMDYFPHLHKGIILYELGETEKAQAELEISISQSPADKAYIFLDKVRKRSMEQTKIKVSVPRISIDPPGMETAEFKFRTNQYPVRISGKAEDLQFISEVRIDKKRIFLDFARKHVAFDEAFYFPEGEYEIRIFAKNLLGGTSQQKRFVVVDRSGPVITLKKIDISNRVAGNVGDPSGILSFQIFLGGSNKITVPVDKNGDFSFRIQNDTDQITFSASDTLGNETHSVIDPAYLSGLPVYITQYGVADHGTQTFSPARTEIDLNGRRNDETVFTGVVEISGQARSGSPIIKLQMHMASDAGNAEKAVQIIDPSAAPGRIISFKKSVGLNIGKNIITFHLGTTSGKEYTKRIRIYRQIPEPFRYKNRYALQLNPLNDYPEGLKTAVISRFFKKFSLYNPVGTLESEKGSRFISMMRKALFEQKRFQLIAGSQVPVRITGMNTAKKKAPDGMLSGYSLKDRNGATIVMRLIDSETGTIIGSLIDVFIDADESNGIESAAMKLAAKMQRKYPLSHGSVIETNGRTGSIEIEDKPFHEGWPVWIYEENPMRKNSITGLTSDAPYKIVALVYMNGKNKFKADSGTNIIKIGQKMVGK